LKPLSNAEAFWRSEYNWEKGRVSKEFKKKYGRRQAQASSLRYLKKQLKRARRRALKRMEE
jgi:hypothetical protein